MWLQSWLRYCATSQKVAVLIPEGVNAIFLGHNPSGRTMSLGSTQPLTKMSTMNISWRVKAAVQKADNLTTFMWQLSWNLRGSNFWNSQGLSRPVQGLLYLCLLLFSQCGTQWHGSKSHQKRLWRVLRSVVHPMQWMRLTMICCGLTV
jgi:hypothetical protein